MLPVSHRRAPAMHVSHPAVDPVLLFAVEGALLQLFSSINGFSNNLFATELGATDLQIGLVQTIPNLVAVLLLLPLGILADRLRSSRTIPMLCLLFVSGGFVLMSAVPMLRALRIPMFFVALAFTVGVPALYNAQWQTFFGDVVADGERNRALTLRNRLTFAIGILAPLVGGLMMRGGNNMGVFRMLFLVCAAATLMQAGVISGIHTPERQSVSARFSGKDLVEAVGQMAHSRSFLLFFIPVLLFYMTWQMDWSMWYIGQVQYLELTQSQMTLYNALFNAGQLVAVGVLSGTVRRRGADRTLPYAALGLMSCPLIMIVCTRIPADYRMVVFSLSMAVLNAPQCATNLCIVQILLRVVPQQCRSIAVSLYTLTITLSNCFMPFLGVKLYTALGSDYRALILFNVVVFCLRGFTYSLLLLRCRVMKEEM